jgi:hypothetical protein
LHGTLRTLPLTQRHCGRRRTERLVDLELDRQAVAVPSEAAGAVVARRARKARHHVLACVVALLRGAHVCGARRVRRCRAHAGAAGVRACARAAGSQRGRAAQQRQRGRAAAVAAAPAFRAHDADEARAHAP